MDYLSPIDCDENSTIVRTRRRSFSAYFSKEKHSQEKIKNPHRERHNSLSEPTTLTRRPSTSKFSR